VVAGNQFSAALTETGKVVVWGTVLVTTIEQPPAIEYVKSLCAGQKHLGVLATDDCDGNGVLDKEELDERDCNGNGVVDACDAAVGLAEDCNANGIGDACEKVLQVDVSSGNLGPIGAGSPQQWTLLRAVPAIGPVTVRVQGSGDFSTTAEWVSVQIAGGPEHQALAGTGDCEPGTQATEWQLSAAEFNQYIQPNGQIPFSFVASGAVDPDNCLWGSWVSVSLYYAGAASSDCNANGILDSCEIAEGIALDDNGNGLIDQCEPPPPCQSDLTGDGTVSGADLGVLLAAWGDAPASTADLTGDGVVNGADLGLLLASWGDC